MGPINARHHAVQLLLEAAGVRHAHVRATPPALALRGLTMRYAGGTS
jgi:hypothetical protein